MKPIILKDHYITHPLLLEDEDKPKSKIDTIIFKNYILYANSFWSLTDKNLTQHKLIEYDVSDADWKQVKDAIEAGEGDTDTSERLADFALTYCRNVELDPLMRQIVLNSDNPTLALYWCRFVSNDDDMRQIIIDTPYDFTRILQYCQFVEKDDDMREMLLNQNDPRLALQYCKTSGNDDDMRQIVLDAGDPKLAYEWCKNVSNDDDMREIVFNSDDPIWQYLYRQNIDSHDYGLR